jgi:tetratricopeptide (TPR) repeat protein
VWQELRSELHGKGLEIVTVALDSAGPEAVRPWVEAARPEHPALIDERHLLDDLFGIVNVPNGVWIDEEGVIVRPAEPAFAAYPEALAEPVPEDASPYKQRILLLEKQLLVEHEKYVAAVRDWAERGAQSRYVLTPEQVVARSQPRGRESSLAAAHFELGCHLRRLGHPDDAVAHFKEAHRLQPDNWTYKCQAWSFVAPDLGPSEEYDTDWASEVERMGVERYYPPLEL